MPGSLSAAAILGTIAIIGIVGGLSAAGYTAGRRARQVRLERTRAPLRAAGAQPITTAVYAGGLPGYAPQAVELFADRQALWLVPLHTDDDARPVPLAEIIALDVREHYYPPRVLPFTRHILCRDNGGGDARSAANIEHRGSHRRSPRPREV